MQPVYVVVDLGFGDAGKGSLVDYLAQTTEASAVIRYTGGPHAAHHVVRPDGVSHAFCQFGASFKKGLCSHLAQNVVVKPENLLYEAEALRTKGVADALSRLSLHPECRVVTSFHAMLCQMKEVARGDQKWGTVGLGVGEAVYDSEQNPAQALRLCDLLNPVTAQKKVRAHYEQKCAEALQLLRMSTDEHVADELQNIYAAFTGAGRLSEVLDLYHCFAREMRGGYASDVAQFNRFLNLPGPIIFEGAHASLLDYRYGYFPYVAKTDTTTGEAMRLLEAAGYQGETMVIGAFRALGYRHGPGPFVTEDRQLGGEALRERHNKPNLWQGAARYGWLDLVALRHSLALNARVDCLAVTMLDRLARLDRYRVCLAYEYLGSRRDLLNQYVEWTPYQANRIRITGIKKTPNRKSAELAQLLFDCAPLDWLDLGPGDGSDAGFTAARVPELVNNLVGFLESREGLGLPVTILSHGPTVLEKICREGVTSLRPRRLCHA